MYFFYIVLPFHFPPIYFPSVFISVFLPFFMHFCLIMQMRVAVVQGVSRGRPFAYWLIDIREHRSTFHALLPAHTLQKWLPPVTAEAPG